MQSETGIWLSICKFIFNSSNSIWPLLESLRTLPNALRFPFKNLIPFLESSVVLQANTTFPCFLHKAGYWFITFSLWQQINAPGSSLSDDPKNAEQLFSWGNEHQGFLFVNWGWSHCPSPFFVLEQKKLVWWLLTSHFQLCYSLGH